MNEYTSRNEAIAREITDALGTEAENFDIDAIADETLDSFEHGYRFTVDPETFWVIVERHAL